VKELGEIIELLAQAIPSDAIHAADPERGIYGDYITAQYAMQRANQIFDLDGISDIELISANQYELPKADLPFGDWIFDRVVKVWVRTSDGELTPRIGQGIGVAQAPYNSKTRTFESVRPQQMDTAIKTALSDALKNALMRFGRALGAELYFDERQAQALGYEDFSARATKQSEQDEVELPDIMVPEGGWGNQKKFGGMTLREIYMDVDGFGAMEWASRQETPYGITARMAEYFKLMQAEGKETAEQVKKSTTQAKAGQVVTMWFGKEKPANEITSGTGAWGELAKSQGFLDMLVDKFNPDGTIPSFHANHPRVINHFKRHFHIDKGEELTWNMLQALYTFCTEGSEVAAFGWPEYYAGDRAPTEATLAAEKSDESEDILDKMFDGPMLAIGPGGKQKVPVGIQKMIKEAGIDNPDDWLWEVIGEEPVGDWSNVHTELLMKLLTIVKDKGITDIAIIKIMWEAGIGQLV
jgi:hypothetical protein